MFSREYDLRRHLKWHDDNLQRIESFLNSIEKEETPEGEPLVKKPGWIYCQMKHQ